MDYFFKNILARNPNAVPKLEVAGKEHIDSVDKVLELIGHRLCSESTDLDIEATFCIPDLVNVCQLGGGIHLALTTI